MDLNVVYMLGMVGALAPEIIRLYSIRDNPAQFKWSWFYLVISILFACLGGVVALVLPAITYWGALYAGISTPVLVNSAFKKGIELSEPKRKLKGPAVPTVKYS